MRNSRVAFGVLLVLAVVFVPVSGIQARQHPNTVTFDNKSGEPALVKLIGPTRATVGVPNFGSRTVSVSAGTYYILVRYGAAGRYSYARGQEFLIRHSAEQYSAVRITLHKVAGGNYSSRPISAAEFGSTQ